MSPGGFKHFGCALQLEVSTPTAELAGWHRLAHLAMVILYLILTPSTLLIDISGFIALFFCKPFFLD